MELKVGNSNTQGGGNPVDTYNNPEGSQVKPPVKDTDEENLEDEYLDKRIVIISPVENYPLYRKVNFMSMGQRRETIGGCINTSRILPSNKGEMDAYMPGIIGLSPQHPDFTTRVKAWFDNISFPVSEENTELDASFLYNHKKDYLKIQKEEDEIERRYAKINRANIKEVKDALKIRIDSLNTLEGTKYKYGHPTNVEQYLIYRHCLLYHQVAKDTALINSDPTIRFYIKDQDKELRKARQLVTARKNAMQAYIELAGTDEKYNAVYLQICNVLGSDLGVSLAKPRMEKDIDMMNFVNNNPRKFNEIVKDKNLIMKSFIETLILHGELVRSDYNQQILNAEGEFIGANMNEAVAYFNNPENKGKLMMYQSKLKLM